MRMWMNEGCACTLTHVMMKLDTHHDWTMLKTKKLAAQWLTNTSLISLS